ncbi:hypothetical protein [Halogeometricum borinquense]|uniref:hypothetical protein n=1 Tax=Halogeometricum borinquense TaxID=60847 RepID=UPI001EF8A568|nr:hypothetical protein [Halogeometricum borinquense]
MTGSQTGGDATTTATMRFVADVDDQSPTLCEWDGGGDDPYQQNVVGGEPNTAAEESESLGEESNAGEQASNADGKVSNADGRFGDEFDRDGTR